MTITSVKHCGSAGLSHILGSLGDRHGGPQEGGGMCQANKEDDKEWEATAFESLK